MSKGDGNEAKDLATAAAPDQQTAETPAAAPKYTVKEKAIHDAAFKEGRKQERREQRLIQRGSFFSPISTISKMRFLRD